MTKFLSFIFLIFVVVLHAEITVEENGMLNTTRKGQFLFLQGTPYERGVQHGKLLKTQIERNIAQYIDSSTEKPNQRIEEFLENLPTLLQHVPLHFIEEMQGLADGSGIPYKKILMLNLFPEMFHCTGITASKDATLDHKLYHVRVLDYAIGKDLQKTAVLMIVKPKEGNTYLNVSYAGFIGSITGMNEKKIAIGEIGGQGYGNWDGVPMAFLIREILEKASTLDEAKALLKNSPRTCEYFYVISDGNAEAACGVYATESDIEFIKPGALFALPNKDQEEELGVFISQPTDCITLTRDEKYSILHDRIEQKYGKITREDLQEIIKAPIAHDSNLHNVIFCPSELTFWISHAGDAGEPAYERPYQYFSLKYLLEAFLIF